MYWRPAFQIHKDITVRTSNETVAIIMQLGLEKAPQMSRLFCERRYDGQIKGLKVRRGLKTSDLVSKRVELTKLQPA